MTTVNDLEIEKRLVKAEHNWALNRCAYHMLAAAEAEGTCALKKYNTRVQERKAAEPAYKAAVEAKRIAVGMCQNSRLGCGSLLGLLEPGILELIMVHIPFPPYSAMMSVLESQIWTEKVQKTNLSFMFSGRWTYVTHVGGGEEEHGWGSDYAGTIPQVTVTDLDDLRLKTSKECNNRVYVTDLELLNVLNINVKNAVAFIKEVEDAAFDAWRKSSLNITNTSDVMENDVSRVRHYRKRGDVSRVQHYRKRGVRQYFQ